MSILTDCIIDSTFQKYILAVLYISTYQEYSLITQNICTYCQYLMALVRLYLHDVQTDFTKGLYIITVHSDLIIECTHWPYWMTVHTNYTYSSNILTE